MSTLNDKIVQLEEKIKILETKLDDITRNVQDKNIVPHSKVGLETTKSQTRPIDTATGFGNIYGGNIIWNDSEMKLPPWGIAPDEPTKGYNKHGHGRYSGGALDIHTLELVEYTTHPTDKDSLDYPIILDAKGNPVNKHCQQFWKKKITNEKVEIVKENNVEKIGLLDIEFDTDKKRWVAGAGNVDVETTNLVQYAWYKEGEEVSEETEGATRQIKKDTNGIEMKSPLLYILADKTTIAGRNENLNKSNVYWDENAQSWRFYAVFKPSPEIEEG